MQIRDIRGNTMNIDFEGTITVAQLKQIIQDKLCTVRPNIILVGNGRKLVDTDIIEQSYSIIVVKLFFDEDFTQDTVATETPDTVADTEAPSTPSTETPATETPATETTATSYQRVYNSIDLYEAINVSPLILINIISLISHSNPFFLSYIATNPAMVRTQLMDMFNDPAFNLTVRCASADQDPIRNALNNALDNDSDDSDDSDVTDSDEDSEDEQLSDLPFTENSSFDQDRSTVQRILNEMELGDDMYEQVKSIYLVLDRDEEATLLNLRH